MSRNPDATRLLQVSLVPRVSLSCPPELEKRGGQENKGTRLALSCLAAKLPSNLTAKETGAMDVGMIKDGIGNKNFI